MSPIVCTGAVQHRSFRDRVDHILARAIRGLVSGFVPLILMAWLFLAITALNIVLLALFAVVSLFTMGVTGQWDGLGHLGVVLLAGIVRTLLVLAITAALLWANDLSGRLAAPRPRLH